jgi:hypothetical protein
MSQVGFSSSSTISVEPNQHQRACEWTLAAHRAEKRSNSGLPDEMLGGLA